MLALEEEALQQGYTSVAGVDEVGRGPLAGPVVAAACIVTPGVEIPGVDDSKKLTERRRSDVASFLRQSSDVIFAIAEVDHKRIDEINILQATIEAMIQAVDALAKKADYLLVDGLLLPHPTIPGRKVIKGDSLSQSIAAASILAKVYRDDLMKEYDKQWPHYGFSGNKGYPTARHREALGEHGPCPIHRLSFSPVREVCTR